MNPSKPQDVLCGASWGSLCILFAMRRESAPFRRAFPHTLTLETGIGQANVAGALDGLLARFQPKLLLFAGFAGALTDALHVGDVLFVDEVLDMHGQLWPTTYA